jgi:hypothetical protein
MFYPEPSATRPFTEIPLEFDGLPGRLAAKVLPLECLTDCTGAGAFLSTPASPQWRMFDIVVLS